MRSHNEDHNHQADVICHNTLSHFGQNYFSSSAYYAFMM